ncbi:MAG TPA: polysaccharide deacetylase family protein [Blastocatellia bacterium]
METAPKKESNAINHREQRSWKTSTGAIACAVSLLSAVIRATRDRAGQHCYAAGKRFVMIVYLYSGFAGLRDLILSALGRSRVVVVYYHRIGQPDVLTRSLRDFEQDLRYYKENYECLSLSELCWRLKSGVTFRRRAVVITFDDGYRDNFTLAVPALRRARLTATFFVATGYVGTTREFAHDHRQAPDRNEAESYPKLEWDDLRTMETLGFEVGSHTENHTNLGTASVQEVEQEVRDSFEALNRRLGKNPRPFSFPWGKPSDISPAALQCVKRVGYYCAASAYGGANRFGASTLDIKRIDVGNGGISRLAFKAKLAGFDPDYYRLKLRERSRAKSPVSVSGELEIYCK